MLCHKVHKLLLVKLERIAIARVKKKITKSKCKISRAGTHSGEGKACGMRRASLKIGAVCALLRCASQTYANLVGRRPRRMHYLEVQKKIPLGFNQILKRV